MKIELYLKNVNQEIIGTRKVRGLRFGESGWSVSWPKSCCILDFSLVPDRERIQDSPARGFVLRSEPGGGMFWDPKSSSVYKVDEEAYHAMLELDHGLREDAVARRLGVSLKDVHALTTQLRRIQARGSR